MAVALATGAALADSRDDAGTGAGIRLDWSAISASEAEAPSADTRSDGLAPDLQALFPGYALQSDPAFEGLLAGEPSALPDVSLFQSQRFVGTTIALAGDLHLHLGAVDTRPDQADLPAVSNLEQLQLSRAATFDGSRTILAGADWNVASWGGLGIAASHFTQSGTGLGAALGDEFPGARVATMFGVSAHLNFGDGWITSFSYDEGRTQFDLRPDTLSLNDETTSRIFDFTVSKADVFGGDAFGLSWVRPAQPSDSVLLAPQISLSSWTPESDFQLDYETSFNGNVTLQANAGYQMNVGGQSGTKAISVLSRAKINF